jgi:hypothetical protein
VHPSATERPLFAVGAPTTAGFSDVAGDTFVNYLETPDPTGPWGSRVNPTGNLLVKVGPTGAEQWLLELPASATVQTVLPATGTTYVTGNVTGTDDLGCGVIAGSGVYAGAIDTCGSCIWSRAAGTSASFAGNVDGYDYLLGNFTGTLDVGCGAMTSATSTAYAAKVDAAGTCEWSRTLPVTPSSFEVLPTGEPLIMAPLSGAVSFGCGTVTGSSGVIAAELDAMGACVWSKSFAGSFTIAPYPTGDIAVRTLFSGSFDFGCGPLGSVGTEDLAVGRLDGATGACLWSESFGGAGAAINLNAGMMSVSALGYVVMTGSVGSGGSGVDLGGGSLSNTGFALELDGTGAYRFQSAFPFNATQVALDPCGTVLVGTTCSTCSSGDPGLTVTKLAP